jgi:serine/threonine-protein kinase
LDGRLELKGLLGEGGMGQVHRAWDRTLERAVAVKFVRGTDPREAERLLLEARLQARVEHPHVVRVHEVGTLEGRPCIVMQLVEGPTLADACREAAMETSVELLRQAALGLHAAHLQGLVHRDVKPGNVLTEVAEGGKLRALVSDFGLARDEDAGHTRTGLPAGTLDFMAPEVLVGGLPVDFRADVYALGATAYAVLSGRLPFRATTAPSRAATGTARPTDPGDDSSQLLRRILEENPEPLANVPRDLRTIVAKAMEKAPADRYASAEAFAEDLGRFQRGEPILAQRATAFDHLLKWSRRNPTAARATIAALLAITLGLGYGFWTTRRAARQSLEAARLGAEAESMEARLRQEYLYPAHNISPVLSDIRKQVEALRAPTLKQDGPTSFALGKGLDLLGDLEGARVAYQRAWDEGFRVPATAEALGVVLCRLYAKQIDQAKGSLSPEGLQARKAGLQRIFRDPALALLSRGQTQGWRAPWARVFLRRLDDDLAGARAECQAVLALDPGRYEARTVEAEIWLAEANDHLNAGRSAEEEAALTEAEKALTEAAKWGRSDPRIPQAMAELHRIRAKALKLKGSSPEPAISDCLLWLDRTAELDPHHLGSALIRGEALLDRAVYLAPQGGTAWEAPQDLAIRTLQTAVAEQPDDWVPRSMLTFGLYDRALQKQVRGTLKDEFEAAQASFRVLRSLAPKQPEVRALGMGIGLTEAQMLQAQGKDAGAVFQSIIDEGEDALRLLPKNPVQVFRLLSAALAGKGKEDWLHGRDPRPAFARVLETADQIARLAPKDIWAMNNAVDDLTDVADAFRNLGMDPSPALDRARSLSDKAYALGHFAPLLDSRVNILLIGAAARVDRREDPTALLKEIGPCLRLPADGKLTLTQWSILAYRALTEARWMAIQQVDPSKHLAEAERWFSLAVRANPGLGLLHQGQALCAAERADWGARKGHPAPSEAERGLTSIAKAMALQPRDPSLPVIQAHLQGLSGQREAGLASLQQAVSLNALIEGSLDFKRTSAELQAP